MKKIILVSAICHLLSAICLPAAAPGIITLPGSGSSNTNLPGISVTDANTRNIRRHQALWANTNNMVSTTWTNGKSAWTLAGLETNSSGQLYYYSGSIGAAVSTVKVPPNGEARFISSFTVPAGGLKDTYLLMGLTTNTTELLAGTSGQFRSFGIVNGAQALTTYVVAGSPSGAEYYPSSYGKIAVTNGTYNVCVSVDVSNVSFVVLAPGHTNEYRYVVARSKFNPTLTNTFALALLAGTDKTNGVKFNAVGGRGNGTQTIYPRTAVEGRANFVLCTTTTNGDRIRVVVPASYDTKTNIGNLLVTCHGNSGDEFDSFDLLSSDGSTKVRDWYLGVMTNNFIIASCYGWDGYSGTWGTSNSVRALDDLINWVSQRYAFSNVFLIGESAGCATVENYVTSQKRKIAGAILNHGIYSPTNRYAGQSNDINTAYGGTTLAQLATSKNAAGFYQGDPSGVPVSRFSGVPLRIIASPDDATVTKTNQTDLLITRLGGTVGHNSTNLTYVPELDSVTVTGAHGDPSHYTNIVGDVAFMLRCLTYTNWRAHPGIITP